MKILIEVTVPDPVGFDSLGREEQMFWITQDPDWQQVTGDPIGYAYANQDLIGSVIGAKGEWAPKEVPLYAAPVLRSLSDDAILDMAEGCTAQYHDLLNFARAIEAALRGEK